MQEVAEHALLRVGAVREMKSPAAEGGSEDEEISEVEEMSAASRSSESEASSPSSPSSRRKRSLEEGRAEDENAKRQRGPRAAFFSGSEASSPSPRGKRGSEEERAEDAKRRGTGEFFPQESLRQKRPEEDHSDDEQPQRWKRLKSSAQ